MIERVAVTVRCDLPGCDEEEVVLIDGMYATCVVSSLRDRGWAREPGWSGPHGLGDWACPACTREIKSHWKRRTA